MKIKQIITAAIVGGFLLAAPATYAQTVRTLTVTVVPDRDPDTAGWQVFEGDPVRLLLTLDGLSAGGSVETSDVLLGRPGSGSATFGMDYQYTCTIASTTGPVPVFCSRTLTPDALSQGEDIFAIVDDDMAEGDETIFIPFDGRGGNRPLVQASNIRGTTDTIRVSPADGITITILANDGHSSVRELPQARTLTVTGPTTHTETDAASNVRYTVTLTRPFTQSTMVFLSFGVGGSLGSFDDRDFTGLEEEDPSVTFNPGDIEKVFVLGISGDDISEAPISFSVQARPLDPSADGGTAFGPAVTTTIVDDDQISASTMRLDGPDSVLEERSGENAYTYTIHLGAEVDGQGRDEAVTVSIGRDSSSTAATPRDYSISPAVIRIRDGRSSGTFTLTTTDGGGTGTADRTLMLTLTATGGANTASDARIMETITLTENRVLTVTGPASIAEGGAGNYTIALSGNNFNSATPVTWTVTHAGNNPAGESDAGLASAADFAATTTGQVTFAATDRSQPFTLNIAGDTLNEAPETFTVQVSVANRAADGGTAYGAPARTTINDDDALSMSISAVSASVAEDASAGAGFTFTLTGSRSGDVVVPFILSGLDTSEYGAITRSGSAANLPALAIDSDGAGGSVTFAMDDSNLLSISVALNDDTLNEATETLTITGGVPSATGAIAYSTGGDMASVSITDNDPVVASIANTANTDADTATTGHQVEEGDPARFTVTLTGGSRPAGHVSTIAYTVATSGTGNVQAADISSAAAGTITIDAPATSGEIRVTLIEDADTDAENLVVTLDATGHSSNGFGAVNRHATAGRQSATQQVVTRTATHRFALTSPAATIAETDSDANTRYTLERTGPAITGAAITVTWEVVAGSTNPVVAADFSGNAFPTGMLRFSGSQTSRTFDIGIEGDNLNEADETFTIQFRTAASGAAVQGDHAVTIADDDPIALSIPATRSAAEGGSATIRVDLDAIPSRDVTVTYAIALDSDDATVNADISGGSADITNTSGGSIVISANSGTAGNITIGINQDTLNEAAETFTVTITTANIDGEYGTPAVPAGTTTVTIARSDDITVTLARMSGETGGINEGQSARFTVTLTDGAGNTRASAGAISVAYAIAGVSDATGSPASPLSFAVGDTSATFTVTVPNSDRRDSGDETLRVSLGTITPDTANGAGQVSGTGSETVVVTHQMAAHSFTFTSPDTSITEGDAAVTYTVTRTGDDIATGGSITITWTYAAGTPAPVAADFTGGLPAGDTLVFSGAETTKTFMVTVEDDALNEAAERFTLTLSIAQTHMAAATTAGGASLPSSPTTVTIVDNDPVTVEITRASGTGAVAESSGALSFTVTIAGGTRASGVSTVVPFSIGGAGITADDYAITAPAGLAASATGGSVTIAQSASTATITVTITDDSLNEAAETLTVTGAPAGGSGLRLTGAGAGGVEYTTGGNEAGVSITDDDPITVTIAGPADTVDEYGTAVYTVSLTDGSGNARLSAGPIAVAYAAAWTATSTGAFTDMGGSPLTIAAGSTSGPIRLTIDHSTALTDDSPDEMLRVTLGDITPNTAMGAGAAMAASSPNNAADATVNWITARHVMTLVSPAATITETDSSLTQQYTMMRGGDAPAITGDGITVTWTVTAGSGNPVVAADFSGDAFPAGTVTFTGTQTSQTFSIGIAGDNLSEMNETFTIAFSIASAHQAAATANNGVAVPSDLSVTINDDDDISITIGGDRQVGEEETVSIPVTLSATPTAQLTVQWVIAGDTDDSLASSCANPSNDVIAAVAGDFSDSLGGDGLMMFAAAQTLTFAPGSTSQTITLHTTAGVEVDGSADNSCDRRFTLTLSMVSGGGGATPTFADMNMMVTITIREDDPAARSARLKAPTAAVAKGIGQLASQAVVKRLAASVAGGNALTVAGRNLIGGEMETFAAEYLSSGRDLSAAELLRQSGFSFTHGDGGRGFNFWGGGSYVSADGDHDGVSYDGDVTAWHVGVDTHWRDGLIGVAVGTSDGDTDFTVTADGMKSTLETDVTSVHPYLTRKFGGSQLWTTVGYGTGDAELKEDNATIKTDLTVTTAAFGISHALGNQLAARASALYSRAELDAATGDGKSLPATDADSTRLTAGLEAAWLAGPWRLFLASDARHDSGDGDTGGALDLGGGVEWRASTIHIRLEGGGHLLGQDAADESRVSFTARKTTGRVTLGLNLGADATGLDTARLLYGEWRF